MRATMYQYSIEAHTCGGGGRFTRGALILSKCICRVKRKLFIPPPRGERGAMCFEKVCLKTICIIDTVVATGCHRTGGAPF